MSRKHIKRREYEPLNRGRSLWQQVNDLLAGELPAAITALQFHIPVQATRADLLGMDHTTLSKWEIHIAAQSRKRAAGTTPTPPPDNAPPDTPH